MCPLKTWKPAYTSWVLTQVHMSAYICRTKCSSTFPCERAHSMLKCSNVYTLEYVDWVHIIQQSTSIACILIKVFCGMFRKMPLNFYPVQIHVTTISIYIEISLSIHPLWFTWVTCGLSRVWNIKIKSECEREMKRPGYSLRASRGGRRDEVWGRSQQESS